MPELAFRCEEDLYQYLTTSNPGRCLLREAVARADWLIEEIVGANKTTYVLVKAYQDLVEVYGPPAVRAKILLLNRSQTFPEAEIESEQRIDRHLPEPYLAYHFPSYKRAAALRGHDA